MYEKSEKSVKGEALTDWEKSIFDRLEKGECGTITTPSDMDITEYGFFRMGKESRVNQRWIRKTVKREIERRYYHKKHPEARYNIIRSVEVNK